MENQIKSFEHACEVLNRPNTLPDLSMLPEKDQKAIIAHYKLTVICEAANYLLAGKPWFPDWHDDSQWKYYPWFRMDVKDDSGSGLSCGDYVDDVSCSIVGSRLCLKTAELAKYVGQTFIQLYRDYFVI
jgi:hypothetical protein